MAYITKPGSGARMVAPGTSQAMASSEISSSEPLPSIRSKPSGSFAWRASACAGRSTRVAGVAVQGHGGQPLAQLRLQRRRQAVRVLHGIELHQAGESWTA
jgi:hypothetical protein